MANETENTIVETQEIFVIRCIFTCDEPLAERTVEELLQDYLDKFSLGTNSKITVESVRWADGKEEYFGHGKENIEP